MPGLVPGIHVLSGSKRKDVDGGDEPGHDDDQSFFGRIASAVP
jgi:hypothetical protein